VALLPEVPPMSADGVLLHIGVHKTGTTAIQAALADARPELRAHDVSYPGKLQAQHRAALALLQRHWGWNTRGGSVLDPAHFEKLANRVNRHRGRVVISSEFFCEADADKARTVVDALGSQRLHVVVTLRNLGRLLPSSWQQYLKYGLTTPYEAWLTDIFNQPGSSKMSPTFWRRHDHGAVVERWAAAVGPERLTVLVLEDVDRSAVFVTFAQMLGIAPEVLTSRMELTSNRSMTAAEAALLMQLNARVKKQMQWEEYVRFVRRGVALGMVEGRTPADTEQRLVTPDWALDAAAEAGNRAADAIAASGVHILGNLDTLRNRIPGEPSETEQPVDVPLEAAVQAIITVIETARAEEDSTIDQAKALARRIRRNLRRR